MYTNVSIMTLYFSLTPANRYCNGEIASNGCIGEHYLKFPMKTDGNGCHAQEGDKEEVVQ